MYLQKEGSIPIKMWTLTGSQPDDWFQGKVGYTIDGDHSILIESRLTEVKDGDMGLDDISITPGSCPTFPAYAIPTDGLTTTAPPVTTPQFVDSVGSFPPPERSAFLCRTTPPHPASPYDCNFEKDACPPWAILGKAELLWTRVQGLTASQDDAHNPLFDHTGGQAQGYYLLLKHNQSVALPNVRLSDRLCRSTGIVSLRSSRPTHHRNSVVH